MGLEYRLYGFYGVDASSNQAPGVPFTGVKHQAKPQENPSTLNPKP